MQERSTDVLNWCVKSISWLCVERLLRAARCVECKTRFLAQLAHSSMGERLRKLVARITTLWGFEWWKVRQVLWYSAYLAVGGKSSVDVVQAPQQA